MERISVEDFGLTNMSNEYKRNFLYEMDLQIKNIHKDKGYVGDFKADNIFISDETRTPSFEQVNRIPTYLDDTMFINSDVINEALFALTLYMGSEFQLGMIPNAEVMASNFDAIKAFFPEEDVEYYSDLFSKVKNGNSDEIMYYSDYVNKKMQSSSIGNKQVLTKSTAVGRSMADNEEGNISNVFIISLVCTAVVMFIGLVISFLKF